MVLLSFVYGWGDGDWWTVGQRWKVEMSIFHNSQKHHLFRVSKYMGQKEYICTFKVCSTAYEYEARLRGDTNEEDLDDYIVEQVRQAKQASLNSKYEWEQRQHFRQQTRGFGNIYEQGGSSHASGSDSSRP
ncbi:unnamed protein product [Lupinus luteus]|uniref:Uncharacterized protein n=1 Tax=Lupinus luteus TaxID=3873 RepID=A0AAV1W2U9_LUPLU